MFLTQAIPKNGFPFEITMPRSESPYAPMTENELLSKLETSRQHAKQGNVKDAKNALTILMSLKVSEFSTNVFN